MGNKIIKVPKKELIGQVFGKLTVIAEAPSIRQWVKRWLCLCSCGNKVITSKYSLLHDKTKSCGCWGREQNLTGKTFGKLLVIKRAPNFGNVKSWLCLCTCGKTIAVRVHNLKSHNTLSCGCLKKETKINENDLINNLYRRYKKAAQTRDLTFDLDIDTFTLLIKSDCHYCGSDPLNNYYEKYKFKYNGVDRVNNTIGYVNNNCVSCCYICNNAKKDHTVDAFKNWAIQLGSSIESSKNPIIKSIYDKIVNRPVS